MHGTMDCPTAGVGRHSVQGGCHEPRACIPKQETNMHSCPSRALAVQSLQAVFAAAGPSTAPLLIPHLALQL